MREKISKNLYFEIKNGRIEEFLGRGVPPGLYKKIGGVLTGIRGVDKKFEGREDDVRFVYLYLRDDAEDCVYVIQCAAYNGAGANIIRALAQAVRDGRDLKDEEIVIDVYSRKNDNRSFTNASVFMGEEKLPWAELPKGGDYPAIFEGMISEIAEFFKGGAPGQEEDDMPPGDGDYNPFNRNS